jgi:SAM-dependent methyltransferase
MEKREYQVMFEIEDDYWWYVALRDLIVSLLKKYGPAGAGMRILDAGCGTGGFLCRCPSGSTFGFDVSAEALSFCSRRKIAGLARASAAQIPYASGSFDAVVSCDVLYYLWEQGDQRGLKEFHRVLKPGGIAVLNLPALDFLKSEHDRAVHVSHRYSRKEIVAKLSDAGFTVLKAGYRNSLLLPLMVLLRLKDKLFLPKTEEAHSDLKPLPGPLNALLTRALLFENRLVLSGLSFPAGLSVVCVGRKD